MAQTPIPKRARPGLWPTHITGNGADSLLPPVTRSSEGLFCECLPAVAASSPLPPKNLRFVFFVVEVPRLSTPRAARCPIAPLATLLPPAPIGCDFVAE